MPGIFILIQMTIFGLFMTIMTHLLFIDMTLKTMNQKNLPALLIKMETLSVLNMV